MERKYFGTDGIRGVTNSFPMTAQTALKVAMATASVLRRNEPSGDTDQSKVVIGKDTRLSGYMIEQAMASGFVSMGMDVVLVGPVPTPAVAVLTGSMRADIGVMISASHNPFQDNGIKIFGADGYKLPDEIEQKIEEKIDSDFIGELSLPADIGKASRLDDATGRYIEFIKGSLPRGDSLSGLKVVVDCANGAAYKIAPQILWELEAEVIKEGVSPNGHNINEACGATDVSMLCNTVIENEADIGIALDGDADRLIMVDEKGKVIDGDQIISLLALDMSERGELNGNTVVTTVMSNLGMEKFLSSKGINMIRTKVGDRYVVEEMRNKGYNLGGEQSGHIVMSDYATTGDGILAAIHVLSKLKREKRKASEVLRLFEPFPQILKNIRFEGEKNPLENKTVIDFIAKEEEKLGKSGRILVRKSGTEPLIRVMAEGEDKNEINTVVDRVCEAMKAG